MLRSYCYLFDPMLVHFEDLETLLLTSKTCIVLRTWFVLPCPPLPQQSSQNFCIFRVGKNCRTPFWHALCWHLGAHSHLLPRRHCRKRQVKFKGELFQPVSSISWISLSGYTSCICRNVYFLSRMMGNRSIDCILIRFNLTVMLWGWKNASWEK